MRILFLPNWRVYSEPGDRQAPDYDVPERPYWFFRHFLDEPEVDVLDAARWPRFGLEDRLLHFYALQGLEAAVASRRYDVVLAHGSQSAVMLLALARTLRLRLPPVVVIDVGVFNHGHPEKRASFGLVRWALGTAARVIWHSTASLRMAERWAPEVARRGEFVPFGIDVEQWRPSSGDDGFALCVGYAFRDYPLLSKAWTMLPEVPLVVLGAQHAAAPDLLATRIGRVSFTDYQAQMTRARVVVHPLPDGAASFGQMTLLDAFAAAKPVVVSDVAPVRDYLGPWCRAVDSGDAASFARYVRELWPMLPSGLSWGRMPVWRPTTASASVKWPCA